MTQTNTSVVPVTKKKSKVSRYNKWGYIFLIPFFSVYLLFSLIPLVTTIYDSFFHYINSAGKIVGPEFVGFENYAKILGGAELWNYTANTFIMWILGFIPQILVSLLLASWFSDTRLKLKGAGFFKTVIYLPNLIMAAAFAMLFYALFNSHGAFTSILVKWGWVDDGFDFFKTVWGTRGLVGLMNFLMWFGNTTILLMAGIMGIDVSLYEAAEVDGANSKQRFFRITMPLLKPIFIYVLITSLIGGIQMYDVPKILTKNGSPIRGTTYTANTLIMYLNDFLTPNKNYGMAGALSVILFIITGALSLVVYRIMYSKKAKEAA